MKKMMMIAVMAVAFTLNVSGQDQRPQFGQRMDRTEMIKMRSEAMAKQYGLDEAQQQKLLELNQKYPEAMPRMGMGMRPGGQMGNRPGNGGQGRPQGDNDQQRPRRQMGQGGGQGGPGFGGPRGGGPRGPRMADPETLEKYNKELKGIMTEEQFKKFESDQAEARKRMMERMQQMQGQQQ